MLNRWLLAVLALGVSALQAWDSHALTARPGSLVLVVLILLITPITIVLSRAVAARLGAALVSVVALFLVRLISTVHLPELALAAAFPALLVLADYFGETRRT